MTTGTSGVRRGVWRAVLLGGVVTSMLGVPAGVRAQGPTPYPENQPFVNTSGSRAARGVGQGLQLSASLYAGALVGGRQRLEDVDPAVEQRLAPAATVGLRLELSTSRYIALGVFMDYLRTEVLVLLEDPDPDVLSRTGMVSVGVSFKLRAPFALGRTRASVYVGVPLGMAVLRPPRVLGGQTEVGVFFGGLVGLQVEVNDHVGVFVEAGVRAARFENLLVGLRQGAVHAGAAYAF